MILTMSKMRCSIRMAPSVMVRLVMARRAGGRTDRAVDSGIGRTNSGFPSGRDEATPVVVASEAARCREAEISASLSFAA